MLPCVGAVLLAQWCAAQSAPLLQTAVDRAFAGQPGAAVVLRVQDGHVLAMHNQRALARRIATPGSAIKPFVLELLLEKAAVRETERIACRRPLVIDQRSFTCSHPAEISTLNAEEALALSCNSYFVTAASRLHPGELEKRFAQLGFTSTTDFLPDEGQGRILPERTLADRQLLAIGAAGIQITPLELAKGYLELAKSAGAEGKTPRAIVLAGLRAATDYGLARGAKPEKISVTGKTGTAADPQDPNTHAWFAGFAPAERPEIVVVVFLERGHGSIEAAMVARHIFEAYAEDRK
jgi:cell division protein FtsI/penicillin-binding protein 2